MHKVPLLPRPEGFTIPRRPKPSDLLAERVRAEMATGSEESGIPQDVNSKRKQPGDDDALDISEIQALGDAQAALAEEVEGVKNELRFVHRDLKHNDLRITNVNKEHPESGERHPVHVLRDIMQFGMKVDLNTAMEMTAPGRLVYARWENSRRKENGGKHTLMVRFASDMDTKFMLDKKKGMGNYCVDGCSRPVSINKDFSPKDHLDQLRAKTVSRALAEKKNVSWKGPEIKLRGNRIAFQNSVKTWQDWIQVEKLIPDATKMGPGWKQPVFGPDAGAGAASSYASATKKPRQE